MRKPRVEFAGGLYHVISRGNQRRRVFYQERDFRHYLELLSGRVDDGKIRIYAYCLMPNHVHLLVEQTSAVPLSKFMQRLQTAYTVWFNRKHGQVGHLFQGRYKAILVDRETYFMELIRYIHLNPYRAKLEKEMGAYPWTSHTQYLQWERKPRVSVETSSLLSRFSENRKRAVRLYERFVRDGLGQGHRGDLYDLRGGLILGDEKFEEEILAKCPEVEPSQAVKIQADLGQVWEAVRRKSGKMEKLSGRSATRLMEEAVYLAVMRCGFTQREAGAFFRLRQSAVSHAIHRLEKRWREDSGEKDRWFRWVRSLKFNN